MQPGELGMAPGTKLVADLGTDRIIWDAPTPACGATKDEAA
jgi:hypothetical protein